MGLVEALGADETMVCAVGAGGKKTTLYALADRMERAAVTATVRIPIFDRRVADVVVTPDPISAVENATRWPVGVVPERERDDRYRGYDPETVASLADSGAAETVLVKADGARARQFKAPNDREPQIPGNADVVLPVVSARVVGRPLTSEFVHRVDRVSSITGLEPGEIIEPADVASVLVSERGGMKGVPDGATVVPVVNMVDDENLEGTGCEIADRVLARANVPRVVLAQMTAPEPLVGIVD